MKRKIRQAGWDDLPEDVKVHVATKLPFRSQLSLGVTAKQERRVARDAVPLRAKASAPTVARGMDAAVRLAARTIEKALKATIASAERDDDCGGPLWQCEEAGVAGFVKDVSLEAHARGVEMTLTAFGHDFMGFEGDPFEGSPGIEAAISFPHDPHVPDLIFGDAMDLRPGGARVAALRPVLRPAPHELRNPKERALAAAYDLAVGEVNAWLARRR